MNLDKNSNKLTIALDFHSFCMQMHQENVLVVDTRHPTNFVENHIANSIFLGIDGPFDIWAKILLSESKKQLLIVPSHKRHEEVIAKLKSLGITRIIGYLNEPLDRYSEECTSIASISADDFKNNYTKSSLIFDVRKDNEYLESHLKSVLHTPLNFIDEYLRLFPKKESYYLFCGGGYRSVIAASILKSKGFVNPINIEGGFKAIASTGISGVV